MGILDTVTATLNQYGIIGYVTLFIIIIGVVIIVSGVTFWLIMKRLYGKKIVIFEKVGGTIQVTKRDVGRDVRIGEGGDYILYTRRFKKFLPTPQIQTGQNVFWYYIREDGEWINIGIEDIDTRMRKAKAHFLDKEMRYARTALQRNLKERLQKISFWDKYGAMIIWTLYIAVVGVMTWLLFDKWIELSSSVNAMLETQVQVIDLSREILQSVDNIKTGGEGITPA